MKISDQKRKIKLLVSVRSLQESLLAAKNNVDFIDIKEPKNGPLGAAPISTIAEIANHFTLKNIDVSISSAIDNNHRKVNDRVINLRTYLRTNIDFLKIGIDGDQDSLDSFLKIYYSNSVLSLLSSEKRKFTRCLIPVFLLDKPIEIKLFRIILESKLADYFYGLMIDTKNKSHGTILDLVSYEDLKVIKKLCLKKNKYFGMAGSLDHSCISAIKDTKPNWVGFRGGLCVNGRGSTLCVEKIKEVRGALN